MISFGASMPAGASQFLPVDNDELGKNIESIKQIYGAIDIKEEQLTLFAAAKSSNTNAAKGLEETLIGLQMLGQSILGGSKRADQQLYARLLEAAVIERKSAEVSLQLAVPQSDVDALMGILLKDK